MSRDELLLRLLYCRCKSCDDLVFNYLETSHNRTPEQNTIEIQKIYYLCRNVFKQEIL